MTTSDPKKLIDYLLSDLRTLSTEAKKKHNHVKDAAESCLVKIRNINDSSGPHSLLQNIRSACTEILHPLILSCSTKNPRLVQIALQAIQHMLQFRVVSAESAPLIVTELWNLSENDCEQLRVLQTLTPFVTAEVLVTDTSLAKCIALAIHLNFSKDPSVINAASAAIRQLFSCVFERVIQEDGMKGAAEMTIVPQTVRQTTSTVPPTLRPCAADGYLLLKDLIALIRKENPTWLVNVTRISLTLALDLLESILKNYPSIFFKHTEYAELLKESICPQLIKLFAGEKDFKMLTNSPERNAANRRSLSNLSSTSMQNTAIGQQQKPFFSIMMRSIRLTYVLISNYHEILTVQTEILVTFLLELLSPDVQEWQPAVSLEVLHKLIVQPSLIAWFCEHYDLQPSSNNLIEMMASKIKTFIVKMLEHAAIDDTLNERDVSSTNRVSETGFVFNGSFTPLAENISAKRWVVLEWLDRNEPATIQQGYSLSIAYYALMGIAHSVYAVVEEQSSPTFRKAHQSMDPQKHKDDSVKTTIIFNCFYLELSVQLFLSTYPHLLSGFNVLLESSIDDSISEAVLNCMSTVVVLACRTGNNAGRDNTLKTICRAALPQNYFSTYIDAVLSHSPNGVSKTDTNNSDTKPITSDINVNGEPSQVIAMGSVCPTKFLSSSQLNTVVMLTSKNMQVARLLIMCVQSNGKLLNESWEIVLTTFQHLYWILGMKPTPTGGYKSDSSSTNSAADASNSLNTSSLNASSNNATTIVTTALSSELPALNQSLNKIFEQTADYTDVSLHHVIASLCKLSAEAMIIAQTSSKEPSFFSVAKLLQTGLSNLQRLSVFWRPVVAHLLEVCGHNNTALRDWGSTALTTLVKSGLQALPKITEDELERIKYEQLIMTPLASMSEIDYADVRAKQLDCLMHVLQSDRCQFHSQLWPLIVRIVTSIVESKNAANSELVDQAFSIVKLIIKEFLNSLPFECVQMIVETNAQYGHQQINMNISLASVGLLWDISDLVSREGPKNEAAQTEQMWLVLYNCLSELCVDSRPPIRKSACDTFLQTVAAHGHSLNSRTWSHMIWKILFPMLDKVKAETRSASKQKTAGHGLGAANIMIHHSRDTESKQWAETTVRTLSGVVKIFNAQRNILLALENFGSCWKNLLSYIEYVAGTDNSEMSLAALKNFQELLFGRGQSVADGKTKTGPQEEVALPLPENLWIVSWQAWIRIAHAVISPCIPEKSLFSSDVPTEGQTTYHKHYIPGTFHFTTLLSAFQPLFYRVAKELDVSEVKSNGVLSIFRAILKIPLSPEQGPFMINAQNSDIGPAQECILDSLYVLYQKELEPNSNLRLGIPDLLRTLLEFVGYSIRAPTSDFLPQAGKDGQISWAQQNLISFGELSLRTCVSYYSAVAKYPEIIDELLFVDIIKCIAAPLALKYECPSQSTWKIAASSLTAVCLVGLPIAREKPQHFEKLWPELANCIENFLFTAHKSPTPLNADERKRHEYVDCQIIDLIRSEILPFADKLPSPFMQSIIEILNRGSINTMDSNDILASDSFAQRADLSRVCFDALLSLSRSDIPENSPQKETVERKLSNSLGSTAISSLLHRCRQVLSNYARDEQGSGHFRLPQERIFEVISVLRAVSTLIDGLAKHPDAVRSNLYSHLAGLHPNLVELIPSCRSNREVELNLMIALNSYQTLLLLNVHSKP